MPAALNAPGQVVGWSTTPTPPSPLALPQTQAFIYQNGRMERLILPGETFGVTHDINDRGQVVTTSRGADNTSRGAIFHPAGPPPF